MGLTALPWPLERQAPVQCSFDHCLIAFVTPCHAPLARWSILHPPQHLPVAGSVLLMSTAQAPQPPSPQPSLVLCAHVERGAGQVDASLTARGQWIPHRTAFAQSHTLTPACVRIHSFRDRLPSLPGTVCGLPLTLTTNSLGDVVVVNTILGCLSATTARSAGAVHRL